MRRLRRVVHALVGHPKDACEDIPLGYRCTTCGARFGRWDYP